MFITLPPSFGAGLLRKRKARKDLVGDLREVAVDFGYPGDTSDLQAMADFVWDAHPSDGVGELLQELAAGGHIRTPWGSGAMMRPAFGAKGEWLIDVALDNVAAIERLHDEMLNAADDVAELASEAAELGAGDAPVRDPGAVRAAIQASMANLQGERESLRRLESGEPVASVSWWERLRPVEGGRQVTDTDRRAAGGVAVMAAPESLASGVGSARAPALPGNGMSAGGSPESQPLRSPRTQLRPSRRTRWSPCLS
jgi:hypothetical protein